MTKPAEADPCIGEVEWEDMDRIVAEFALRLGDERKMLTAGLTLVRWARGLGCTTGEVAHAVRTLETSTLPAGAGDNVRPWPIFRHRRGRPH